MPKKHEEISRAEIDDLIQAADDSKWKQVYHVQPPFGFLGAPTGFNYINGIYHLFYEWSPDSSLTETPDSKYIYHATSKDLVTFRSEGVKVRPDSLYDSANIFGGSLSKVFNEICYFYTGERLKSDELITAQLGGYMNTDGKIQKYASPLVRNNASGYTEYFRNPYVTVIDREVVMFIGTMNREEFGRVLIYRGPSVENLKFDGELDTGYKVFGHLWEQPEFFDLDMDSVFIFNVRGLDKFDTHFWNIYQSGYMVGDFERRGNYFIHDEFYEFDGGFDFYRPATAVDEDGNRVLIAWMAAEESAYPLAAEGTLNAMTIPRILSVDEDRIRQLPHPNLEKMRGEAITAEGYFREYPTKLTAFYGEVYELIIDILENNASTLHIYMRKNTRHETKLVYDSEQRILTLDRTFSGEEIQNVDGLKRRIKLEENLQNLRIYMDRSSIEVFINDGKYTMTARIFPSDKAEGLEMVTEFGDCRVQLTQYSLEVK
ncbi:glycoside hydrolase family 32 protein [Jeotgalicoccus halotolerans]|uniref:beta-fructofuranosidase n=1 Tax=Jeotgalicoccus halotolerans TaxID=157227 RepID=A0A3E0AVJ3_9STAP|nr:GH32 C-terminal domain-containing protein [Jeotgalicoccus halotolerans]REG23759.1 beta-fructofuranosidase [Jeotgalicoccus halotolerans]